MMYFYAGRAIAHAVTGVAATLSVAYLYSRARPRIFSIQHQQNDTTNLRIHTAAGDSVGVRSITHEGIDCLRGKGYDVQTADTTRVTERSVAILRVRGSQCDPLVFDACNVSTHIRTDSNRLHTINWNQQQKSASYTELTSLTH